MYKIIMYYNHLEIKNISKYTIDLLVTNHMYVC